MKANRVSWLEDCPSCGFLRSSLPLLESLPETVIDEDARRKALGKLRSANARLVLQRLNILKPLKGLSLCDIGCGPGWFLQEACAWGLQGLGLDPEACALGVAPQGFVLRQGFFPAALDEKEIFDLICFNDVLEHLPNIENMLRSCLPHLRRGGYLSIVIPNSKGLYYQLGKLFHRLGYTEAFHRLWQKGFSYPHLSYVNPTHLPRLAQRVGMEPVYSGFLPSTLAGSLWSRASLSRKTSFASKCLLFLGLCALRPFESLGPKDCLHQVFRRP